MMKILLPFSLLLITSCTLLVGRLPTPDPIWQAANGFGPHDIKTGCLVINGSPPDCSTSEERVMRYLSTFLPSDPQSLAESLKKNDFRCDVDQNFWACSYTKSQPPATCVTSYRVSVSVRYAKNIPFVTEKNILLKTMSVPDPENHDNRGCFPL